jgi:DHA3 family tetracycline resistance protein-like MFS transporter
VNLARVGIVSIGRRLTTARIVQPLRHRDFALLTGGRTVSLVGDGFFFVALAWQVYLISNDPGALSLVFLAGSIPLVAFLLLGGALSDRYDRRLLMIGADVVRGIAIGVLGLLSISGQIQLWHIAVVEAIAGGASAFFNPASTAIVPDVLPDADLPQANALFGILRRMTVSLLGPALGGIVVAAFGPGPAFIVDALSFAGSAVAVFAIRTRPFVHHDAENSLRHTLGQMREGFLYVRQKPWIWATLLSAMLSLLFFIGPVQVLLPFLVKNSLGLGPDSLGTILAFGAVGAIAMGLTIGHFGLPRRRVTVMFLAFSLGVAGMAGYGVMSVLWQALLIAAVTNAMFELGDVIWTTLLQQLVPRNFLGRVSSLDWMLSTGLVPLSYALVGPVSAVLGPRTTMVAGALIGAVVMFALIVVPGVRDPERQPLPAPDSGQGGEDLVGL